MIAAGKPNKIYGCLLLLFSGASSFAQLSGADSSLYQNALANSLKIYRQKLGDQSGLYNGTQYGGYPYTFSAGHPFFLSETFNMGSVLYDHMLYEGRDLLYDEISETLIFRETARRIQLQSEKVSGFTISGYRFIRIYTDSSEFSIPQTGFYQVLYGGHTEALKKEEKKIREVLGNSTEGIQRFVDSKVHYFMHLNDRYYPVSSKRDLLKILVSRKKELQQYIKKEKLNIRREKDNFLTRVAAYYDQLTH